MPRIKIRKSLYEDLCLIAEARGYSDVKEFIEHLLEDGAKSAAAEVSDEEVRKRLEGLGYL